MPPAVGYGSTGRLDLSHFRPIPVANLACRHERDAIVADHIIEQSLQILDPMRNASDVGVDGDCHDARVRCCFKIETIELIGAALQKLLGRKVLQCVNYDIVRLHRVGNRRDRAVRGSDVLRKIVDYPIRHIFDAVEAQ